MNCKQIHELLPLYAGRDLEEKRARLVGEHIQICADCARVADEYRDSVELTQHFAPPVFTDDVYASVRRQVLRQIENDPTAPLLPQIFPSWFQPRMAWAAAGALVIALGFFALYLIVKPEPDAQPVADNHPAVNRAEQSPESTATPQTTAHGTTQKPAQHKRTGSPSFVNRSPLVAVKAPGSSSREATVSPKLLDPEAANSLPAADAVPGESPLRVEMQTKDPNIRIIWFTQTNTKPASPKSKGI